MIVVDASVIIKWFAPAEEGALQAFFLYKNHLEGSEEILTSRLAFYEIANTLATKTKASEKNIKRALFFLFKAQLSVYLESQEELLEASLLAKGHKTSLYDMLYAVIARRKNLSLITADEGFAERAGFPFVKLLTALPANES